MITMSNDINSQLDKEVLDEWRQKIEDNREEKDKHFTSDGLMYYQRSQEELTKAWETSQRRVFFLLRDQNQHRKSGEPTWNEDIRESYLKSEDNRELKTSFMQYLSYFLWSLSKVDVNNDWWFNEVTMHIEEVKKFFIAQPFALVECKKVPGEGSVDKKVVERHLHEYGDLLQKEIRILNPNIIVCAGGEIYDYMIHESYFHNGLVKENGGQNYYYSPSNDTVIIYSEHPGSQMYKGGRTHLTEDLYEGVMYHYRKFIKYRTSL